MLFVFGFIMPRHRQLRARRRIRRRLSRRPPARPAQARARSTTWSSRVVCLARVDALDRRVGHRHCVLALRSHSMRKPVVLITGASGEIGHGLIERLRPTTAARDRHARRHAARARRSRARCSARSTGSILDHARARAHPRGVRGRSHLSSRRAALDAVRVLAGDGAPGQRRGHAESARVRAARGRVARPARRRFSIRRRLPPTGCRRSRRKRRAGRVREDRTGRMPTTMYGCNKLYCEQLGRYYARHYKQLSAEPQSGRVDFRAVRFPGLISAVTVPSGGTSDYAPEMIHAAAKGEAYACFVRPDTRIPFMAMPDGVEALLALARGAARAADADGLQRRRVRADRRRDSRGSAARVSVRRHHLSRSTRSARASSTRGPRTSTMRPRGAIGASRRRTTSTRAFRDYLIPTIRGQYQTKNWRSPAGATIAESARVSRILRDFGRRTGMSLAARERHEPSRIGRRARLAARARLQAGSLPAAQEQRGRVRRHAVQRGTLPHGAIDRVECCRRVPARRRRRLGAVPRGRRPRAGCRARRDRGWDRPRIPVAAVE